ncbi:MAG TPA: hypothetical protein VKR78_01460, partial [Acidimicrobiales bacterium]|nr:hypothetical protein [Acidimicrobiales bacterium]
MTTALWKTTFKSHVAASWNAANAVVGWARAPAKKRIATQSALGVRGHSHHPRSVGDAAPGGLGR